MNNLENLLVQFMLPDNNARKAAEEQIRKLSKDSQIVPALVQLVQSAQDPAVRQLAAVILRKKITGHWMKLAPDVKNSSKTALLESVTMDPAQPVRRASANVVSVIAKHAVPSREWPELLPFLFQCTQSAQEDHREVALIVFNSLTETIGDVLRPHFGTLQSVFVNGLNDQHSNRVRIAALKAVGALVGYIQTEEEVVMFRELIPPILSVSRHCLESGDEDVAVLALEIFDELVESPAPLLGPTIPVIVHFALEVCSNKLLESNTRYQAIQIVSWLAKYKWKTLVRHKLVGPILTVKCPILAEPDARHNESDDSSDRAAAEVLDTMAMSLPKNISLGWYQLAIRPMKERMKLVDWLYCHLMTMMIKGNKGLRNINVLREEFYIRLGLPKPRDGDGETINEWKSELSKLKCTKEWRVFEDSDMIDPWGAPAIHHSIARVLQGIRYDKDAVVTINIKQAGFFFYNTATGGPPTDGEAGPSPAHKSDLFCLWQEILSAIELEAHAVKGIGKTHAKWSPVATARYRMLPEVVLNEVLEGAVADELVAKCPVKIFDIQDVGSGNRRATVARPRDCTLCRECVRGEEWEKRVSLRRVKDHFIC